MEDIYSREQVRYWPKTTRDRKPLRTSLKAIQRRVMLDHVVFYSTESGDVLSYLLNVFAIIGLHAESNKMTIWRLAKVFPPMILLPVKAGKCYIEDEHSELSQ